jgi:TonB family protein
MAGPSSPDPHSRKAQPDPDALNDSASSDAALGRTLKAELTRAATRANPASLTPSAPSAPATPAESSAPVVSDGSDASVASSSASAGAAAGKADADADSAAADADADIDIDIDPGASASGAALADRPEADAVAEDAQSSASHRPRIGWGGVLALLNVVLSGFILMLWGVPRWDVGRVASDSASTGAARVKSPGARGAGAAATAGAGAGGTGVEATGAGASPASAAGGAGVMSSGTAGLNAAGSPGGAARRVTQPGAFDAQGGADGGAGSGVEVPELPQAIISVMPGQRAPDVTVPPPPREPAAAAADDDADARAGEVTAGADDAIEAGNAAARATGDSGAPRIPIAGADGVTMPERLAESHVRPTIAALADGEPVTGEVRLAATIRIDGSVTDVQVLSSSRPGAGLEQAAADAVRRWRYKPAMRNGQPIDSRLTITVTFR